MTINSNVFNTLRGFGYLIKMYDSGGVGPIADPQSAEYIFAWDKNDEGKNLMVRLPKDSETEFPTLIVYKSQKKYDTFLKVFQTLKNIAIGNGCSITIREMGETIEPKKFAYAPKIEKERQARLSESKESNDLRFKLESESKSKENFGEVDITLLNHGWKTIAYGQFAIVYGKQSVPFVVKVIHKEDKGYEAFLSVVRNNKNKHFPVILDEFIINNAYVYFIEDLQPMVVSTKDRSDMEKYFDYLGLVGYDGYDKQKKFIQDYKKSHGSLATAIELLRDAEDEHEDGLIIDFNNEHNFMKRNDGTLVIIDPFISKTATSDDSDEYEYDYDPTDQYI